MAKILVIEDDEELAAVVQDWLTDENHVVDLLTKGADGIERLENYHYDLLILDINLPDMTGIEVCKKFRDSGGTTPILMLTGRTAISDKEQGLDAGADDYLTKPFHPRELSARVRALMRRVGGGNEVATVLKARDLVLDPASHEVTRNGNKISLLPKEFSLLEFLMRHPEEVFSSETLLDRVWSSESDVSPDTVKVHINKLRSKIDVDGETSLIATVHRVGYKLQP